MSLLFSLFLKRRPFDCFICSAIFPNKAAKSIPPSRYVGHSAGSLFYYIFVWISPSDFYTNINQLNVFIVEFNILMNCVFPIRE